MKTLCVYCGSSPGSRPAYAGSARALGRLLAAAKINLVYGGASVGIMGVLADEVIACGGEAIGVIPSAILKKEIAHQGLSELHVVDSMHSRKAMMADLSDGFVALPGGLGTLEELFEILTWTQLGLQQKPCGLLNVNGFYDHLIRFLDHSVTEAFVKPVHRELLLVEDEPERLLEAMQAYRAPRVDKWINPVDS
jgi:uncharacterized protein (TIGR00730 family)